MRTLQEKYNGIQEGKFSKEHFLAEARMQQPQLITRFNGYDDAVQILKNRGMIQEARVDETTIKMIPGRVYASKNGKLTYIGVIPPGGSHKGQKNPTQESLYLFADESGKKGFAFTIEQLKQARMDPMSTAGDFGNLPDANVINAGPGDLLKMISNATVNRTVSGPELNEAKLTKKSLTDYRYKPTNDMDKYPYEQILRGIRVELEALQVLGTPTAEEYSKALAKVSKNLAKDSIFYTNQLAGVNPKVDLHDKMVDATAKNTVDTFNGMKKAELKEGFKRLIKKVLSESMGDMFGDEERAERSANYGQPGENEYEFYSDTENYNEEEEEFDLHGEEEADDIPHPRGYEEASDEETFEDLDESKMGDLYITAQESDSLKDFLIKVKQEYPETNLRKDIEELQHIWNNRGGDSEDELSEGKKSLSELLK
jgi:hypothetical protein